MEGFSEGDYRISLALQEKWNTKTFKGLRASAITSRLPEQGPYQSTILIVLLCSFYILKHRYWLFAFILQICITEMKTWHYFPVCTSYTDLWKDILLWKNCTVTLVYDFRACFDWFYTSPTGQKADHNNYSYPNKWKKAVLKDKIRR